MWLAAIAAALVGYPPVIVAECCDPRVGLARTREFAPTVAAVVEWCSAREQYYRQWARYTAAPKRQERPEAPPSPSMKERVGKLFDALLGTLRIAARGRL